MVVCHKKKFIFIKTKKTASSSFEIALSEYCDDKDIITQLSEEEDRYRKFLFKRGSQNYHYDFENSHRSKEEIIQFLDKGKKFNRHITSSVAKELLSPPIWNEYFKFAVERNPFDRIVSLYYWRGIDAKGVDINEYVNNCPSEILSNSSYYMHNNKLLVDKVFKLEDQDEISSYLTNHLNLSPTFKLPKYKAKSYTRKPDITPASLNTESINKIRQACAFEMELLGYSSKP